MIRLSLIMISILLSIILSISQKLSAQTREQDSLALIAIYNAMGGENWDNKTNWLTTEPIYTWYGVTLADERIAYLFLGSNNLTGKLPEELGNLTRLEDLILHNNHIESPLPVSIKNLTQLWELVLNGNELSGIIPPEIYQLTELRFLNLIGNDLSGTLSPDIGKLINLEYLALSNNQFSGPIPAELGNLTRLDALFIENNQLSGSIPDTLCNLINLQLLYLSNNQLTGSIPAKIGNLTGLNSLFLHHNQLTGSVPSGIINISGLRDLGIEYNQLEDLPDLSNLQMLQWLVVQNNRFTFEDIEPNIGVASESFIYAPQDSVGIGLDTTISIGNSLNISIAVSGTANQYQWMKDEVDIPNATSDNYIVASAQIADAGSYICKINNTIATELALYSRPVTVTVVDPSDLSDIISVIPTEFKLFQNYPNPFNPLTHIRFALPEAEQVQIIIYDILGKEVATILNEKKEAGYHIILFDASKLSSGVYFYAIRADRFQAINKMLLVK